MDGAVLAFLQKQARQVIVGAFSSGKSRGDLMNCIALQFDFYEAIERELKQVAPPKAKIECASGCNSCCYQTAAVTIPEAIALGIWLEETDIEGKERNRILQASRLILEKTDSLDDLERIRTGLPCPLLKDGACSVYAVRPITCRSYYSFSRKSCERVYYEMIFDTNVEIYAELQEARYQITIGFSKGFKDVGLDDGLINLESGLRILLEDPTLIDRFLAGDRAFEPAKYAGYSDKNPQKNNDRRLYES